MQGNMGGCGPLGLKQMCRGGGEATSWVNGEGEEGTYWTDGADNETDMWCSCRALNSLRSWVAKVVFSLMAVTVVVVGKSWWVEVGELLDGLKFCDIPYLWYMQRGSQQKVV